MDILNTFDRYGGLVQNRHLQLQSGKHASGYINADPVLRDVRACREISHGMAAPFVNMGIEVVVSPATGGIVLGTLIALDLADSYGQRTEHVFVEKIGKDENGAVFGFDRVTYDKAVAGKRVLIVDDVMSNDNERGTVFKVCRVVEQHDGNILGVSIIANRCGGTAERLGVPVLRELSSVAFDAWEQADCPLCKAGVPMITNIGHGSAFQQEHPDYHGSFELYVPGS